MAAPTVNSADQKLINKFARLHQNFMQVKDDIKELSNDLLNITEAADELSLLDAEDSEVVPFRIGQTFVHFTNDAIVAQLEELKRNTELTINELMIQNSNSQHEMEDLKRKLYSKFGDRINLESDKE
ncbi:prefoldin subunit [Dictyocaulus viviparus]|uniref:Prefoldin subunit 4 n=1 Tax=Dictyocaulus viviparus TaxID=29172 RepID=A0A0D8XZC1_DICVI|nr:prefoldin subunit [Dictyocaulus viviparus]